MSHLTYMVLPVGEVLIPQNYKSYLTSKKDALLVIKQFNETRFVGVTHDKNLNWKSHIHKLSKKLSCSAGILNLIKDRIPEDLYKSFYFTLFESHLSYGITVWGGVSNNKLEPLFKL